MGVCSEELLPAQVQSGCGGRCKEHAGQPQKNAAGSAKAKPAVRGGTKSQQALQLQREETKLERKIISRTQKEAEKQRRFERKQHKRKEKHRGR